ncbi:hypothetical protein GP486_002209 [Trichoglossum hirsutum]|uniref:Ferredoxin n=1 Tax=Trichoglossum hirsutum TaxID=265104 RepID=A0A9P8LFH5_9PEZI|nr:hypothetical protein GP486_002209 [Trichoglossum hirsutum]
MSIPRRAALRLLLQRNRRPGGDASRVLVQQQQQRRFASNAGGLIPRPSNTTAGAAGRRRNSPFQPCFQRARRRFSVSAVAAHGHVEPPKPGEEIHVTFIDKEGNEHVIEVAKGDNLLDIAQANDLDVEVTDSEFYDKMPEPDDDENDMLDLAFGLTETSRLGCQVKMAPELDGLKVKLPSMTRNLQASDFSKKSAGGAGG